MGTMKIPNMNSSYFQFLNVGTQGKWKNLSQNRCNPGININSGALVTTWIKLWSTFCHIG